MKSAKHRLFAFQWHVPEAGFHWAEVQREGGPQQVLVPASLRSRSYEPLREYTSLFREFASTDPTPDGVLAFANRYGLLGFRDRYEQVIPPEGGAIRHIPTEPLGAWQQEIKKMKNTVGLWDMAQREDEAGLSRHIRWSKDRSSVCVTYQPDLDWVDDDLMEELPEPELFTPGDVVVPALIFVQGQVNGRLSWEERVSPQLVYEARRGQLGLHFIPERLLGALWFQLAQAVGGDKRYRQCYGCGKWFELSPEVARSNRLTCSDACRSRAYRDRKERAVRLAAEGRTPKEIAEELDSDVRTVKGWIKQRKG